MNSSNVSYRTSCFSFFKVGDLVAPLATIPPCQRAATLHRAKLHYASPTPARRNARSDPPPHRGRRARSNLESALPSPWFSASILVRSSFSYPSIILPRDPAHSAGPSRKNRPPLFFDVQNRFQNFIRFLIAFRLPKWCQKPPKMEPKFIKNACFFKVCFRTVFSLILEGFLVAFPGARPLICMVISNEFVGCAFFRRVKKSNQNDLPKSSKMPPKMPPEAFKNRSKNEA